VAAKSWNCHSLLNWPLKLQQLYSLIWRWIVSRFPSFRVASVSLLFHDDGVVVVSVRRIVVAGRAGPVLVVVGMRTVVLQWGWVFRNLGDLREGINVNVCFNGRNYCGEQPLQPMLRHKM
jgi:hypothetical protein